MEFHGCYRLLFVFFFVNVFSHLAPHTHAYRSAVDMTLSPDRAPNFQPVSSPRATSVPIVNSPASSLGPASVPTANSPVSSPEPASVPTANSPVFSSGPASVPTANSPMNYVSFPPSGADAPSEPSLPSQVDASATLNPANLDLSSGITEKNVDPKVQKICDSTDHPLLCLGTVLPLLDHKTDSFSILEVSVKASSELTKFALSMAKKFSNMPGVPPKVASILRDCKDSYDEAMYNFEKAMNALLERDIGTLNTMLSAVITDIGDCEDELSGTGSTSPLSNYAEKLTNMTSNCLAIASLLQH
ncbi:Plant invertase/pectin methylesterase inhibitor superfamily protein [Forsythia ovata]|uniref:Plant invertase/pectin methylesterase inhibitor superfamily protein n=1 Tax=Forsythia ovata TaxID=205694 RepID=A0ABD1PMR8_9LAMI